MSVLVVMDSGAPKKTTKLTRLAFLNRIDPELNAIYTLALTNVDIQIFRDKIMASKFVDVTDEKTIKGIANLKSAGIIGGSRDLVILDVNVREDEAFYE